MPSSTTRYALPYPVSTDPDNPPADFQSLANRLDGIVATWLADVAANRPAASKEGRFFRATDTGAVSYDNGTAWIAAFPVTIPLKTYRIPFAYEVSGPLAVPSGATGYIPPLPFPLAVGQSAKLVGVRLLLRAGTSATLNITQNGASVGGLNGINATTTLTRFTPTTPPNVVDGDLLVPVITAVAGTPDGLTVSLEIDVTD